MDIKEGYGTPIMPQWCKVIYILIGLMHFIFSVLLVLFQSVIETKLVLNKHWKKKFKEIYKEISSSTFAPYKVIDIE